ncbi:MAG: HlyD family efflux transporter periplasmic adaptor subunit [Sulfuritalea sp.]|nr:HlyD family efflux transporter periplasmic adaptor subunit [Sulfuritalea sp.]
MNPHLPSPVLDAVPSAAAATEDDALWRTWAESASVDAAGQAWLALQCSMIEGASRAVLVLGPPDSGPYVPVAVWPPGQTATPLLADVAGNALAQRRPVLLKQRPHSVVASPVLVDGHLHGLVAVESSAQQESRLRHQLQQLRWGSGSLESILRREQSQDEQQTRERLIATLDLVASALAEEGFQAAAQALATDLAIRLDCDRVSIGLVQEKNAKVVAVSHSAEFGERMNLIRAIGTAMDEALDQKSIIVLPAPDDDTLVTRDHAALTREFGSDSVLTIPFAVGELTTGAFCFERPGNRVFDPATVELCQAVVALGSRIIEAKRLNERLLVARIKDAAQGELRKFIGPRHFGRKLAASVAMLLAVFFSFATGEHRVAANATLEGAVRRVLVAPFDGYLASSTHRAGDVVAAGTVLATLDDRDLRLEYYKWSSQRAQYGKQYQEAVALHDRAQSAITQSQVQQADAQMNLLAEQLSRTQIAAPFAGIVVSGDLHQSLGSAVRRGQVLFEVAPLNAYRVILEVDESDITAIKEGQAGSLALTSMPGEVFPLGVTQVTPVAVAREGRSYFRVEALLGRTSDRLRPGMDGVAKVEAGRARLIWIWTHKFVDWLRLTLWTWF